MMTFLKAILSFLTGPFTKVIDKYYEYKVNTKIVEAAVITGAIKSTAKVSAAVSALQQQEIKHRIFLWTKVGFMWLALVYIGAHVLQAVYFHHWGVENVIPSISVWFGYIMMYLFIAGPYGLVDLVQAWIRK